MTKKTKLLLTSFATIAMSASLMVGGTYALFTSETQVNVGVQAGTVEIKATVADNVLTKSRVGWGNWSATPVKTGTTIFSAFENGGGATFTENSVNLELMTPGDQVQFTIDLDNKSNVNAMYRTVVLPTEDTGLLKGLEITFTDVTTAETEKLGSETFIGAAVADWAQLPENKSDVERKILVTITLPKDAGNEYQKKTAKLVYYVEAIQGNADVNNGNVVDAQGYTLIQSATDLWRLSAEYANPNKVSVLSTTQALPKYRLAANIDLNGAPFMPIGTVENPFLGEFDGNGYTVSNFTITGNEAVGLFGFADGGNQKLTVKNLTVKDATINGSHWVGGIVGKLSGNLENCTVENVTVTAVPLNNMNGDKVGGIVGWTSRGEVKGCTAKDVTVAGYRDIGGLVGAAVADNWVTVTGNTVDGVTLSFVEGYQAFDEDGVYEEQKNIAPVAGRKVGNAVVENNSTLDATTPTQVFAGKQAALEAALAADYAEIEIGASFAMEKTMDIATGKSVTFNMNGYTISNSNINNYGELYLVDGALEGCGTDYALYNKDGGVLTIDNMNINNDGNGVIRFDGGETVINSGNFAMANGNQKHVLRVGSDATVTVNGGTFINNTVEYGSIFYVVDSSSVTVNGGTFTTASKAYMIDNKSEITINGGEFNGYYIRTQATGNTVIKGGTFNIQPTDEMMAKDPAVYRVYPNGQMAVYGGTFKVSPQEFANGYQVVQNADGTYTVKPYDVATSDDLKDALADDKAVSLNGNITFTGVAQTPDRNGYVEVYGNKVGFAQYGGVLDGNGNEIIDSQGDKSYVVVTHGGTIKNLTITTGARGIVTYAPTENVYIDNVVVDGAGYALNSTEHGAVDMFVTNSTINGWTSLAGFTSVNFTNCKLGENTLKYWQSFGYSQDYDRLFRVYSDTYFTDCVFEKGYYLDLSAGGKATLKNCTVNGVKITAENYADYVTIEVPTGKTLSDVVTFA